jgi:hypothetical protein
VTVVSRREAHACRRSKVCHRFRTGTGSSCAARKPLRSAMSTITATRMARRSSSSEGVHAAAESRRSVVVGRVTVSLVPVGLRYGKPWDSSPGESLPVGSTAPRNRVTSRSTNSPFARSGGAIDSDYGRAKKITLSRRAAWSSSSTVDAHRQPACRTREVTCPSGERRPRPALSAMGVDDSKLCAIG